MRPSRRWGLCPPGVTRALRVSALALLLLSPALTGCSNASDDDAVVVFAAASLTEAFEEIGEELERTHDARVTFNFGASSDLARSIVDGSPAQVFASADEAMMDVVVEEGDARDRQIFAANHMAIAVAKGNPLAVEDLGDLERISVALCAPEVPCGRYARDVLEAAGASVDARSLEPDVKAVLGRVALGEVDAGIVYGSDVASSDDVSAVSIPDGSNVVARYPIALIGDAPSEAARAFYELVVSEAGIEILERHGFERP
jgi:molybdate transport system substrate-binding protein